MLSPNGRSTGSPKSPDSDDALWDHIVNFDDEKRAALLGHCVSLGITAMHERAYRPGGPVRHAARSNGASDKPTGLPMQSRSTWWQLVGSPRSKTILAA